MIWCHFNLLLFKYLFNAFLREEDKHSMRGKRVAKEALCSLSASSQDLNWPEKEEQTPYLSFQPHSGLSLRKVLVDTIFV